MGLLSNYLNKKTDGATAASSQPVATRSSLNAGEKMEPTKGFYGSWLTSYHKGGIVKKTGPALLKKGERVLTKAQQKKRGRGK